MNAQPKAIKYVGFYDVPANKSENRYFVLAATDKMSYIMAALGKAGFDVQVVSVSYTRNRCTYKGGDLPLENGNTLRLFATTPWGGKFRRIVSGVSMRWLLLVWLLRNTRARETVIVYHSLGYASVVAFARRLRGFRLMLEVEEIYADVSHKWADRKAESRVFRMADAFIFPTGLLDEKLNPRQKPCAIVHGRYEIASVRSHVFEDRRIHVVYAGTLDPRKGGVASAVRAALFLDSRYHVHILGFGSPSETRSMLDLVAEISGRTECRVTYDGLLDGEEYASFLQSCHVGLSTQRLAAEFSETSFPSKVLSYMANGLRVVSIRLRVLEQSGVGDLLFYYDEDTPEAIAVAIKDVDLAQPYECEERLRRLDEGFVRALRGLFT